MTSVSDPPHYPLAMESLLRKRYATNPALLDEILRTFEKSPLMGYRPLPQALRFHQSQKRFRWALGGNRSSKSFSVATEVVWYATGLHPFKIIKTPCDIWYSGITFEKVCDTLWPNIRHLIEGLDYRVAWRSPAMELPNAVFIKVPGGESSITFKAYKQGREVFQSVDKRLAANDEQMPQDIYTELISRIGGRYPLDFIAGLTPLEPQPWLEDRMMIHRPDNWDVFHFPIEDNRRSRGGFIADGEIQALLDEWPEEIRATRANGEWAALSGAIFQTFRRDVHVLNLAAEKELLRYQGDTPYIPVQMQSIGSIDWGGANAFVYLWAVQIPWADNLWYVYDEYYWDARKQGQRRLDEHAEEIKKRTAQWKTGVLRTWADHDPADALMLAHHGVTSLPAVKGPNSVREGIEVIQTLFKVRKDTGRPRLLFAQRCKVLASQIASYRYKAGTADRDPKDGEVVKVDDHTVDSARMLVMSENTKAYEIATTVFRPNTGPRRLGA